MPNFSDPRVAQVLAVFAFFLGAIVGSFLNACIHRLPRGIGIGNPKRSFCPHCKATIPWYRNLPLVSWLLLRGKCASCGAPIPFRYFLVELVTACAFLWIWLAFGPSLAPAYWLFLALLITATFIDFEHYIIPDEITLGGAAAGLLACLALPGLMGTDSRLEALGWSAAGAALGAGVLWAVVEFGKLAFGRKRIVPEKPEPFRLVEGEENPTLVIGGEDWPWDDIFSRESDVLILECREARVNGKRFKDCKARVFFNRIVIDGTEFPIEEVTEFTGVLEAVVIPREAMGFGDVKFMACIGAFLGWQAVVFTIAASSLIGAIVGGATIAVTRGRSGGKIPYGPYLALGAVLWMLCGPQLRDWYFDLLRPRP